MNKYNFNQITKTLDKIFNSGFNTEKKILNIKLEDLEKIKDITSIDMNIIISLKKAIKDKTLIAFLSGYAEEKIEKKKSKIESEVKKDALSNQDSTIKNSYRQTSI